MLLTLALAVPAPHAATDLTNGESVSVPPAVLASHASASGWTLDPRIAETPGQFTGCPDGQRNAEESECLAAVQQAAQGLHVRGIKRPRFWSRLQASKSLRSSNVHNELLLSILSLW